MVLFPFKIPGAFSKTKSNWQLYRRFYCAASKVAVELDGGGHYDPESMQKDAIRTDHLNQYGIHVIRFCNLDVDRNFYEVCSVIDDTVKKYYRRGTPPVTP